jgi:hypothetical protein
MSGTLKYGKYHIVHPIKETILLIDFKSIKQFYYGNLN